MMSCPTIRREAIRSHYQISTLFYRLLWGRHIHHGLWDGMESPVAAQEKLTATLAAAAGIVGGERIVDVGCGMGGSSIFLAGRHQCSVTGITLSSLQRWWASQSARWRGVRQRTKFLCGDVESAEFESESFDVVWSIECTEHLFDKPRFFQRAARWLRPGGCVAICAWLAGDPLDSIEKQRLVYDVCEGFICPSLGTKRNYESWLAGAGLELQRSELWTRRVMRTWEICMKRVERTGVGRLSRMFDRDTSLFLRRFQTILTAYETGAMEYGCFVARKPV